MQTPISEYIRQLRRQRGMTQTELGGEHFSKSYVSAVEREKIVPSYAALRFFAEQLDQSADYFQELAEQPVPLPQNTTQLVSSFENEDDDELDESIELLDMVLEGSELQHTSFSQKVSTLPLEALMRLPFQKQARYCLMKGLILQEQGNLADAQSLLERALVLSPTKNQSAILDALGTNYSLAFSYQTASSYHQRALHLLDLDETDRKTSALFLKIKLHCGDDQRALNRHAEALEHYEHARQSLRSTSNMDIAAQVYIGLGYCTYASVYQNPTATKVSYEEKERRLQQAATFLLQSRTLYQISSNRTGEAKARLLHASVLLSICSLRRHAALERAQDGEAIRSLQCATLLDEAGEQCRQVLLVWNETMLISNQSSSDLEIVLYTALSTLVSTYIQRAVIARLEGYNDTALHDRAYAAHLCQQILDTLTKPELLHSLTRDALAPEIRGIYSSQALPRLPDLDKNVPPHHPMSIAIIFSAAGEVAEELGRFATNSVYAATCYAHANTCFKTSLRIDRQSTFSKEHDASFLMRRCQHYITLIEERLQSTTENTEETCKMILDLFKDTVY